MAQPKPIDWRILLGLWVAVAGLLLARAIFQYGSVPLYGDGDDAMRMTTALDLLNGQSWFDPIEHRDNVPFGASMHWSRLVDLPLVLLTMLFSPLGTVAPDAAAIAWPLILLLPLIVLCVAITRQVVPDADTLTAAVLPCVGLVLFVEFLPGRVDHHSTQILLVLGFVFTILAWRTRVPGGLAAGLIAATSLAVGLEPLPLIVVGIGLFGLFWALRPFEQRRATAAFGGALAAGTLCHFVIATPPSAYLAAACDHLSIVFVVGAVFAGLLYIAVTFVPARTVAARLAVLGVPGALGIVVLVALFPHCLSGPYGDVDPRIMAQFVSIAEAQSAWTRIIVNPPTGLAFCVPAFVGLFVTARQAFAAAGPAKRQWYILFAFLLVACLFMLVQIRGARFADPLAMPAGASIILAARAQLQLRRSVASIGAVFGAWLLSAGVAQFAVVGALASVGPQTDAAAGSSRDQQSRAECFLASNFDALAQLAPARLMAAAPIGAHILRYTKHSVVSAGFHRNNAGNLDRLDFFTGDEATAHAIALARGIDYVAYCARAVARGRDTMPESAFHRLREDGRHWDWLEPVSSPDDPIQILRVVGGPATLRVGVLDGELRLRGSL